MAVFQGTAGADNLVGGAENDILIGEAGADTLNGGAGADTMIGGADNDTYTVDNVGDVVTETIPTGAGNDAATNGIDQVNTSIDYTLGANVEDILAIGTGNLSLNGNALVNVITGNSGANVIYGGADSAGAAADTLAGGLGNDTYLIRDGADDLIIEGVDNTASATGGIDTAIVVASQTRTSYALDAAAAVENLIASDASSTLSLDLTGSTFAQTIVGNAGNNALNGGINAAGQAADTLIGLGGNDSYTVTSANTVVVENAGEGFDNATIATGATAGTYSFAGVETITAAGVAAGTLINITGGVENQLITGSAGTNSIVGGGGVDTLVGGLGSDTYTVDSLNDVVTEQLAGDATAATSGAADRVIALNSSYALAAASGVEYLTAGGTTLSRQTSQGDGTFDLNALNTTVTSNYFVGDTATAQTIFGDAGGNILNGRIGTGVGGAGDTLVGGNGNDTYRVYGSTDVVVEDTNGGTQDFVYTSATFSLAANDTAAAAATFVDDTITGGAPAGVTRTFGGVAGVGAYVTGPLQIEVLSAAQQDSTTAMDLTGNAYGQIIIGNYAANVISDGGSLLNGVQYQDQLAGLRGNDTYNVTAQNTTVNENAGEGRDVVNVNLDAVTATNGTGFFGLIGAAEVEFVTATGAAAISLQGNQYNQVLTGNAAANTLDGNGGQDTLVGLDGSDSYVVNAANAANVTIIEGVGAANDVDRVVTSVSFDLGATNVDYVDAAGATVIGTGTIGIEQIVVANGQGTEAINLTGNGAAQILVGNFGNNVLNGDNNTVNADGVQIGTADSNGATDGGADTLTGLLGDDVYRVYSQADVIRENGGEGNDTVFAGTGIAGAGSNYQLRVGNSIETLSAANQSGTVAMTLIGNEFSQTIIGTNANDTIWGGNGNDTLLGRGGVDTFGFAQSGAANADVLQDFTAGDTIGLYTGATNTFATQSFSAITAGTTGGLDADEFVVGTQAQDANDYIIYNQATGQLFYDADGNGAAANAVVFATLAPGTALGFNDFTALTVAPTTAVAA